MIKYLKKLYYRWKYRHDKVVDVVLADYARERSIIITCTERPDTNNVILPKILFLKKCPPLIGFEFMTSPGPSNWSDNLKDITVPRLSIEQIIDYQLPLKV